MERNYCLGFRAWGSGDGKGNGNYGLFLAGTENLALSPINPKPRFTGRTGAVVQLVYVCSLRLAK